MRVYLCRHAHAAPGDPDELRALTPSGRAEAQALAARLAAATPPPAVVVTSPLLRARQTAEEIARTVGIGLRVDERLRPGATLERVEEVAAALPSPVALVGHQPDCSEIVRGLTGRDPGFPPGGMAAVELPS